MMTSPQENSLSVTTESFGDRPSQPEIYLQDGVLYIKAGQSMDVRKRVMVRYGGRGRKVVVELIGGEQSGSFTYLVDIKKVIALSVIDPHHRLDFTNETSIWMQVQGRKSGFL